MEVNNGSVLNRLVGVGERTDKDTGRTEKVFEFYPSIFRNVISAFELLPVQKYFGLTILQAMAMPFDEWQAVHKSAERLLEKDRETPSTEDKLMELIKEMMLGRGEG